jgi:hypothetical protein
MGRAAPIRVASSDIGPHPEILGLNPSFRAAVPILKLELDVSWRPGKPMRALADLEDRLAELSPSLRRHQCRAEHRYLLLRGRDADQGGGAEPYEAGLALSHLFEHVLIDSVAFLTDEARVSGVTGAHRRSTRRFDVFVECSDPKVGPVVVALAMEWVGALVASRTPEGGGRTALEVARELYHRRPKAFGLAELSKFLGREPQHLTEALVWMRRRGLILEDGAASTSHTTAIRYHFPNSDRAAP